MTGDGLKTPRLAPGLEAVAAAFDGFLVDQWGPHPQRLCET